MVAMTLVSFGAESDPTQEAHVEAPRIGFAGWDYPLAVDAELPDPDLGATRAAGRPRSLLIPDLNFLSGGSRSPCT
jgi:hypothetical protein